MSGEPSYSGFPLGGEFRTIIADPPWPYRNGPKGSLRVTPYPTMTEDQIFHLPVGEAACEDSLLLLWTTNAHLALALECVKNWGFDHKTTLTWVKTSKSGKPRPGSGFWIRGATEHALFCVRGRPRCPRSRILDGERIPLYTTAILAPRTRHSEKPARSYVMMEDLGAAPRLELFARRRREGWETWGNEPITHTIGTLRALPTSEVPA